MNQWIKFVKDFAQKNNLSYGDALKQAKPHYKKQQGGGDTVNVPLVRKRITPTLVLPASAPILPMVSPMVAPMVEQIEEVVSSKKKNRQNLDFIDEIQARDKIREKKFDEFESRWKLVQEEEERKEKEKKEKRKSNKPVKEVQVKKSKGKKPCKKVIHIKAHTRINKRCQD